MGPAPIKEFYFENLLARYKSRTDSCILILYSVILLNLHKRFHSFLYSTEFLYKNDMPTETIFLLYFRFLIFDFCSVSCCNGGHWVGTRRICVFSPIIWGKYSSHFHMLLDVGFSQRIFVNLLKVFKLRSGNFSNISFVYVEIIIHNFLLYTF